MRAPLEDLIAPLSFSWEGWGGRRFYVFLDSRLVEEDSSPCSSQW